VRFHPAIVLLAGAAAALAAPAGLSGQPGSRASVLAVSPLQDHVGDPEAAVVVDAALRDALAAGHRLVAPERLRDALRAGRLRDVDAATPEQLARLARETGAELLVSSTLHFAARELPPRVTLSARLYRLGDGEPLRSGFVSVSGLDHRGLLGLGVVTDFDVLARRAAGRLAEALSEPSGGSGRVGRVGRVGAGRAPGALIKVALVPLGSVTDRAGTAAAAAATEAVRAELDRQGVTTVSPGLVIAALRGQGLFVWGGASDALRTLLAERTGARFLLTGSVEAYDVAGSGTEPDPHVALALRLVDAETGRIVWAGGDERTGWDQPGLFRLGRVYTRGELARRMTETLVARLLEERTDLHQSGGSRPGSFRTEGTRP
jgi:hypothetical protein